VQQMVLKCHLAYGRERQLLFLLLQLLFTVVDNQIEYHIDAHSFLIVKSPTLFKLFGAQ
jgi:hypothetical protein